MQPVVGNDEQVLEESAEPPVKNESKHPIICNFCDKTFKFHAKLRQHEKVHYGIKQHECEVCQRRFMHKSTLKCHMRLHTGEKPYKCPHCPKTFRSQTALNCHVFRHTNVGFQCPRCDKVFATSSIVKQHLRQVHTDERLNVCNLCGVTYKHLKSLKLHIRNHQKRVCPECGKSFNSVHAMQKHRKTHIKENLPFKCEHCDRAFQQLDKLTSHEKLRGRGFQCDLCCHSFNKQVYLTNHQHRVHWKEMRLERLRMAEPQSGWKRKGIPKSKHSKMFSEVAESKHDHQERVPDSVAKKQLNKQLNPIVSDDDESETENMIKQSEFGNGNCEMTTKEDEMQYASSFHDITKPEHVPTASIEENQERKALMCEKCGSWYNSSATLAVHRATHHHTTRFQCDQCDRTFGFRCFLEKHIRVDHQHERLSCQLCDKTFKYSQDLKVHMRHHQDPKPYKCDKCDSAFRFSTALRAHKILHEQEFPFRCDTCGKYFRFENNLRIHKRLHSGVRQYVCDICKREFTTKASLLRHLKVHDAGREIACAVCEAVFYKKIDLCIHQTKEHPDNKSVGKLKPIYICEHCGKEFITKGNLTAHSYIHEEVYRFACQLCSQSFKQYAGLRHHMINAHKLTKVPVSAEDCVENVQPLS